MKEQPPVKRCQQEQEIGKGRPFWAQRPQKTVYDSQRSAGQAGIEKTRSRKFRCRHRKSLLSQLPAGRGSS